MRRNGTTISVNTTYTSDRTTGFCAKKAMKSIVLRRDPRMPENDEEQQYCICAAFLFHSQSSPTPGQIECTIVAKQHPAFCFLSAFVSRSEFSARLQLALAGKGRALALCRRSSSGWAAGQAKLEVIRIMPAYSSCVIRARKILRQSTDPHSLVPVHPSSVTDAVARQVLLSVVFLVEENIFG